MKKRPKKLLPRKRLGSELSKTTGRMSIVCSPRGKSAGLIIVVEKKGEKYKIIFPDKTVQRVGSMTELWNLLGLKTKAGWESIVQVRLSTPEEMALEPAPDPTAAKMDGPNAGSESADTTPKPETTAPKSEAGAPAPEPAAPQPPVDEVSATLEELPEEGSGISTQSCAGRALQEGEVINAGDHLIMIHRDGGVGLHWRVNDQHDRIDEAVLSQGALEEFCGMTADEFNNHPFELHAIPSSPEPAAEAAAPAEPNQGGQPTDQLKPPSAAEPKRKGFGPGDGSGT
jgi:hypothetical protein